MVGVYDHWVIDIGVLGGKISATLAFCFSSAFREMYLFVIPGEVAPSFCVLVQ